MGKSIENGTSEVSHLRANNKEDTQGIKLPIPLESKEDIIKKLKGYNIAIYNEKIVAIDKSLKSLHKVLENLIPEGEICKIEYIEEGASIYGFNI